MERWRARHERLGECLARRPAWLQQAHDLPALYLRAGQVLDALEAYSKCAELPGGRLHHVLAEVSSDEQGQLHQHKPVAAVRELRADRESLFRLGVWDSLDLFFSRAAGRYDEEPQARLMRRLADAAPPRAMVLMPAPTFTPEAAAVFFDHRVRGRLRQLDTDHPGAGFAASLLADYHPGSKAPEAHGRAWTIAVAASYADALWRSSGKGTVAAVMAQLWRGATTQFAPLEAVLPTGRTGVILDISTDLVLAQALHYRHARWAGAANADNGRERHPKAGNEPRFTQRVRLGHLYESTSERWDPQGVASLPLRCYTGWTATQFYEAVFIQHLTDLTTEAADDPC